MIARKVQQTPRGIEPIPGICGEVNNNGSSELFEWLEFNPHSAFSQPHEDILILLNYKDCCLDLMECE